jgi:hypothetical protein
MTDASLTTPPVATPGSRTATGFVLEHSMTAWKARQALIGPTGSEQLIAYSLSVEAVFGNLRALLGQISGLLILIQSRLQRDAADLPDLAIARERWAETIEQLADLNVPDSRAEDRPRLKAAAAHIDAALLTSRCDDILTRSANHRKIDYHSAHNVVRQRAKILGG